MPKVPHVRVRYFAPSHSQASCLWVRPAEQTSGLWTQRWLKQDFSLAPVCMIGRPRVANYSLWSPNKTTLQQGIENKLPNCSMVDHMILGWTCLNYPVCHVLYPSEWWAGEITSLSLKCAVGSLEENLGDLKGKSYLPSVQKETRGKLWLEGGFKWWWLEAGCRWWWLEVGCGCCWLEAGWRCWCQAFFQKLQNGWAADLRPSCSGVRHRPFCTFPIFRSECHPGDSLNCRWQLGNRFLGHGLPSLRGILLGLKEKDLLKSRLTQATIKTISIRGLNGWSQHWL